MEKDEFRRLSHDRTNNTDPNVTHDSKVQDDSSMTASVESAKFPGLDQAEQGRTYSAQDQPVMNKSNSTHVRRETFSPWPVSSSPERRETFSPFQAVTASTDRRETFKPPFVDQTDPKASIEKDRTAPENFTFSRKDT